MDTQDDRIHAVLDGDLPREALTADEERRLQTLESALAEAAASLREAATPDLTAAVMAALPPAEHRGSAAAARTPSHGRVGRLVRWLWSPVTITLRPLHALAGGLALVALLLLPRGSAAPVGVPVQVAQEGAAEPRLYVQFRIEVPGANQVALAGSFTSWQPEHPLTQVAPGVWSTMVALEPGVHDYTFVIDGERMVVDPYAPTVADSFGGSNSRLFLPTPNERV